MNGLGYACLQIIECHFVVLKARRLSAREPGDPGLGFVARPLDLTCEGQHVGGKPRLDDGVRFQIVGARVVGSFLDISAEYVKAAKDRRDGQLVDREGHGRVPWKTSD